jgi:insertion element IS1 protein InsB
VIAGFAGILTLEPVVLLSVIGAMPKFEQHLSYTGQIVAYVLGTREDETFLQLKELLAPFGIVHFYTDGWGAYRRHLDSNTPTIGKQRTQKIERTHSTFRRRIKRLTRKTICFSRSILMHDLVTGLFINRYAFGYAV